MLAALKIGGGLIGNSGALVAHGIEPGTDVVSSLVVWGVLLVSLKPPDENHPYGHGKAELLAAAAASLALLAAVCANHLCMGYSINHVRSAFR